MTLLLRSLRKQPVNAGGGTELRSRYAFHLYKYSRPNINTRKRTESVFYLLRALESVFYLLRGLESVFYAAKHKQFVAMLLKTMFCCLHC